MRKVFVDICGSEHVIADPQCIRNYGHDQTLNLHYDAELIIRPGSPEEISAILKICSQHRIAVTPRGGGSGVTGGALPIRGGIILSLERLNRVLSINQEDRYIVAESGVVTADLCRAAENEGLYFPVAPSSKDFSFVGGNVAENAGSIRSCKYGTTSSFVRNLEVVLPNGAIVWTGSNVAKNATGLNVTPLFVGSEGTLGIITKVVYKLIPRPTSEVWLLAGFANLRQACDAVLDIKRSGLSPSAVELICKNALELTATHLNRPLPLVKENVDAHLLLELQEDSDAAMIGSLEALAGIVQRHTSEEIMVAESAAQKKVLGQLRFSIGDAMTTAGRNYRDVDACVPAANLYAYILEVERICQQYGIPLVCFGHALDGNLHTMLLLDSGGAADEPSRVEKAVAAIYHYAVTAGGVISGEHGIGCLQKEYMPLQFSDNQLALMYSIKSALDPAGILNPGKMFSYQPIDV
jgi:glycolate oxidase